MGFKASGADPGLFTTQFKDGKIYVLVYVNDILVVANNPADIKRVKNRLNSVFQFRNFGEAKYFLGMSLDKRARILKITRERLATELVYRYGMKEGKTKSIPMATSIKLVQATEDNMLDHEAYRYSELVGNLLYFTICTRPDISQVVEVLAQHMATPGMEHWKASKGILRYIAGTLQQGILFGQGSNTVKGYCKADYYGDMNTRRSTTGFVYILNGGAISWGSKLQPTVAA